MGRPADFDNPEPLKVSSSRGLRLRLFSITSALMLAATAVSSPVYGQGSDRVVDGVKPPVPNTTVPEVPVLDYGEDPFTEENIQRRAETFQPPKYVLNYRGRVEGGGREALLADRYIRLLAIASGYEAGGFAQAARQLNERTSEPYDPRNNTPNGMNRLTNFGSYGMAQVGLLAPVLDNCTLEVRTPECPPVDPNIPISVVVRVPEKPLKLNDGREIFANDYLVVLGNPTEIMPNNIDHLADMMYANRFITIGIRMMDSLVRSGIRDRMELHNIVSDDNSEFMVELRTEALFDTLNSVRTLKNLRTDWVSRSGFEDLYNGFISAEALGGEAAARHYLRSRQGLR